MPTVGSVLAVSFPVAASFPVIQGKYRRQPNLQDGAHTSVSRAGPGLKVRWGRGGWRRFGTLLASAKMFLVDDDAVRARKKMTSGAPRGLRRTVDKATLRARGGDGVVARACGWRGGTKEMPAGQPARFWGEMAAAAPQPRALAPTLAGCPAGSRRGSQAGCPEPAKPPDRPAAFGPRPAPSQPAPAPALLAPVKVQDHDDHDGAARRARNGSGGR